MAITGINSINVDSIVSGLMAAEKKRIQPTMAVKAAVDVKISAVGDFMSKLDAFKKNTDDTLSSDAFTTSEKAKAAVVSFVASYNATIGRANEVTKYDVTTKRAGILNGNMAAKAAIGGLKNAIYDTTNAGGLNKLSELGVTLQRDGTLKIDDVKLTDKTTNNLSDVKSLMSKVVSNVDAAVGAGDIKLGASKSTLEGQADRLDKRIEKFNNSLASIEATYRRQFGNVSAKIAHYNDIAAMI